MMNGAAVESGSASGAAAAPETQVLQRSAAANMMNGAAVESVSSSGAAAAPGTHALQRSAAVNMNERAAVASGSRSGSAATPETQMILDYAAVQNGASRSCSAEKRKGEVAGEERNKKARAVESSRNDSGSVTRFKNLYGATIQNGAFTSHSEEKRVEKVAVDKGKQESAAVESRQNDSGSGYGLSLRNLDSATAQNSASRSLGAEKRKEKRTAEEPRKQNPSFGCWRWIDDGLAILANSEVAAKDAKRRTYPVGESSKNSKGRSISVEEGLVQIIDKEKFSLKRKTMPATLKLENLNRPFNCAICMETKQPTESFTVKPCTHKYCIGCVSRYVAAKVEENVSCIGCPDPTCKDGILELEMCKWIVPDGVLDRWGIMLCESTLGIKRFYCPFKDCSALLVNEEDSYQNGAVRITNSECPHCYRMFCAQCKVPWHSGISCEAFQLLPEDERGKDDILLTKLAADKKWQRCPKCRMYVEKLDGCRFMRCRCRYCFCYGCASPMSEESHYCKKCRC